MVNFIELITVYTFKKCGIAWERRELTQKLKKREQFLGHGYGLNGILPKFIP